VVDIQQTIENKHLKNVNTELSVKLHTVALQLEKCQQIIKMVKKVLEINSNQNTMKNLLQEISKLEGENDVETEPKKNL
tara:strand:- start:883 stop:1119 length:237 start_codon:yes stop_codon:yes gene_type:complete